jgi:PAS domain-containing protein
VERNSPPQVISDKFGDEFAAFAFSPIPCCLVNSDGLIETVNELFSSDLLAQPGDSLRTAFGIDDQTSPSDGRGSMLYGGFEQNGELVSVIVTCTRSLRDTGMSLAQIWTGKPFKDAEIARLRTASYPVLRLNINRVISFANPASEAVFGRGASQTLLGREFLSLFAPSDTARLAAAMDRTSTGVCSALSDVDAVPPYQGPVRMILMPEIGAAGNVSGTVVNIVSEKLDRARADIKSEALRAGDWTSRFNSMLIILNSVVPFDQATFGLYAKDGQYFRPIHFYPRDTIHWPARWISVPPSMAEWIKSDISYGDTIALESSFPDIVQNEAFSLNRKAGIQSSVTIRLIGPAGPIAALFLQSRSRGTYDAGVRESVRALDVPEMMLIFERDLAEKTEESKRAIEIQIRASSSLSGAARALVNGLREHSHWENVAFYVVDDRQQKLRLLEQSYAEGFSQPSDWQQKIDSGLLGAALRLNASNNIRDRQPLIIDDTSKSPAHFDYIIVNDRFKSAFAIPLQSNKRWRWVLDVESASVAAFHGPDLDALLDLVPALEAALDRIFITNLNRVLLDNIPEGVVVTDHDGTITSANFAARTRLLGHKDSGSSLGSLADYARDETARGVLLGKYPDTYRRVELMGADGLSHPVLANRNELPTEFQSSVWFFQDLENFDWSVNYRYLRETVNQVAQQVRSPLILACNQLARALTLAQDEQHGDVAKLKATIDRALSEIGKADITFELLAEGLAAAQAPIRFRARVDLGQELQEIQRGLPERDKRHVKLTLAETKNWLEGDGERLRFVLRTILGYLLRVRPIIEDEETPIIVSMESDSAIILVRISIDGVGIVDNSYNEVSDEDRLKDLDPLLQGIVSARDDASLALQTLTRIVNAHGGTLSKRSFAETPVPVWGEFTLTFPAASNLSGARHGG